MVAFLESLSGMTLRGNRSDRATEALSRLRGALLLLSGCLETFLRQCHNFSP